MAQNFSSFTITQPFLGAPLQFQPVLGSQELEQLIDAFVTGSSSKKDKLSSVTIDFYNNATVDLNTGALVRRYDVALSSAWATQPFEQSPLFSQSSGFSPSIYTPSPDSSATFGDSGYGSISMTPPNRNRGSRVSKKAKKETKKTEEVRLPGFSIMTKDGIDVTSTAGRGTKTKEQREHAHLMRIMKACDDCKRKKVRCDPSHRRTDMSRTSSSATKTSSSTRASVPSLSHESTYYSQESITPPSFGTNPIDDFVLFPDDTAFSWNPADMSLHRQGGDLGQFDFDINDIDLDFNSDFPMISESFDFSFDQQPTLSQQHDYTTLVNDQYGLDKWASSFGGPSATHSRPHPSSSTQDSGQLDSSWYSDSFGSNDSTSPISPTTCPPALNSVLGRNTDQSTECSRNIKTNPSCTSRTDSSSLDWSVCDATSFANIPTHANQDLSAPVKSPRYAGFQKEHPSDGSSGTSPFFEQINSLSGYHDQSSQLATLDGLLGESARAAQTAPITVVKAAFSQQQQSPLTATEALDLLTTPVIQSVLSRTEDSSRTASQDQSSEVSSRGAIPRTVPEQDYPLGVGGIDLKYSMLVAIALSASLVIVNGLQAILSSVLSIITFILLLTLIAVAIPGQSSSINTSWICLAALILSSSSPIDVIRETCNQWIGNDSFPAMAKLFLCCVIVAQPPSLQRKEMKGHGSFAVVASLLGFSSDPPAMSSSLKSSSSKLLSGAFQGKELASLFEILSFPAQVV